MKIAYILSNVMPNGGVERIIIDKANALAEQPGMEVHIVSAESHPGDTPAFAISPKVRLHRFGIAFEPGVSPAVRPLTFLLRYYRWRRRIRASIMKFIDSNGIDIMLSTTYDASALPLPGRRCRLIVESHSSRRDTEASSLFPRFRHHSTTRFVSNADALVVLNPEEAEMWPEAKRCEIIGNFTNLRPVAPYDPDTRKAIAMGRIDPQKGFDILVEAWAIVARRHPDWALDIFGRGDMSALARQIHERGLDGIVNLCGVTDNPALEYSRHSLFVLSSRYEGQPLVLLEAASCGLPCVGFDCPHGVRDIISDGENGRLVPFSGRTDSDRAAALADAVCGILDNTESLPRLSAAGRRKAEEFGKKETIGKWMKLFRALMS